MEFKASSSPNNAKYYNEPLQSLFDKLNPSFLIHKFKDHNDDNAISKKSEAFKQELLMKLFSSPEDQESNVNVSDVRGEKRMTAGAAASDGRLAVYFKDLEVSQSDGRDSSASSQMIRFRSYEQIAKVLVHPIILSTELSDIDEDDNLGLDLIRMTGIDPQLHDQLVEREQDQASGYEKVLFDLTMTLDNLQELPFNRGGEFRAVASGVEPSVQAEIERMKRHILEKYKKTVKTNHPLTICLSFNPSFHSVPSELLITPSCPTENYLELKMSGDSIKIPLLSTTQQPSFKLDYRLYFPTNLDSHVHQLKLRIWRLCGSDENINNVGSAAKLPLPRSQSTNSGGKTASESLMTKLSNHLQNLSALNLSHTTSALVSSTYWHHQNCILATGKRIARWDPQNKGSQVWEKSKIIISARDLNALFTRLRESSSPVAGFLCIVAVKDSKLLEPTVNKMVPIGTSGLLFWIDRKHDSQVIMSQSILKCCIILPCELIFPRSLLLSSSLAETLHLPWYQELDYHALYSMLLHDFMALDQRHFYQLQMETSIKRTPPSTASHLVWYTPWQCKKSAQLFLLDFGMRYGVHRHYRILQEWKIYLDLVLTSNTLDFKYLRANILDPLHLEASSNGGKFHFQSIEHSIFVDLMNRTEEYLIKKISLFLNDRIVLQGPSMEFHLCVETLKALYKVRGLPDWEPIFNSLLSSLIKSSAVFIYDRIAGHSDTIKGSTMNRLLRIYEMIQIYLDSLNQFQSTRTTKKDVNNLTASFTIALNSRWIEELECIPWQSLVLKKENSKGLVLHLCSNRNEPFQILNALQTVIQQTMERSQHRITINNAESICEFLVSNWLVCVEQEGYKFIQQVVHQENLDGKRLLKQWGPTGASDSFNLVQRFQLQTQTWLQSMKRELALLNTTTNGDHCSLSDGYQDVMIRILHFYSSWMEQSLNGRLMAMTRDDKSPLKQRLPISISRILCNLYHIERLKEKLLFVLSRKDCAKGKEEWFSASLNHFSDFVAKFWVSDSVARELSGVRVSASSRKLLYGRVKNLVAFSDFVRLERDDELQAGRFLLTKHDYYWAQWSLLKDCIDKFSAGGRCSRLVDQFKQSLLESLSQNLLSAFIKQMTIFLENAPSDLETDDTSLQTNGGSNNKLMTKIFPLKAATKHNNNNNGHIPSSEIRAFLIQDYFHEQVQRVTEIFQVVMDLFPIISCGCEDVAANPSSTCACTVMFKFPQFAVSKSTIEMVRHLSDRRKRGNGGDSVDHLTRLYSLVLKVRALSPEEKNVREINEILSPLKKAIQTGK